MPNAEFRSFLFDPDHPRIAELRGLDAYAYREVARKGDFTGELIRGWTPLYLNPFRGITEAGELRPDLHPLRPAEPGEEAPVAAMMAAAQELLAGLDDQKRAKLCYPVDAPEWQTWANPEFMQFDTGLRLEFEAPEVQRLALALVAASLSPDGWTLTHTTMIMNGFLGQVVGLEGILNELSYNFALYGEVDPVAPWGWQLYGHHCAVNCLVVDGRMTLGPVFLGAEPNVIDEGPYAGAETFTRRIDLGEQLMAALPAAQRERATQYEQLVDPAMPPGRVHPGDERHLAGAFQDNRVIPFEGLPVAEMPERAQQLAWAVVEEFVSLLPAGPRAARLREVVAHRDETWFSWIGGHERGDVFYYRIQSPVIIVELDHHCGVFLDYDTPKPFHIHTVMRTPHGNDYGRAWVGQWQAGTQA
jgi:hypothetical protein